MCKSTERIVNAPPVFTRTRSRGLLILFRCASQIQSLFSCELTFARFRAISGPWKLRILQTELRCNVSILSRLTTFRINSLLGSDGHSSIYPWKWLRTHQQCKIRRARNLYNGQKPGPPRYNAHGTSLISIILTFDDRPHRFFRPGKDEYPEVPYEDVMAKDEAVLQWLDNIVSFSRSRPHIQLLGISTNPLQWTWGFCFVKGVPVDPESTKALIERIAFIRHTHYGISAASWIFW